MKIKTGETTQQIIDATVYCVAEKGYCSSSMQDIASKAGVSKGLLHYHFKSKEELLLTAVTTITEEIVAEIRMRIKNKEPSLKRMLQAASDLFELLIANDERSFFLTEIYLAALHNEKLREQVKGYQKLQADLIEEIMHSAMGELPSSMTLSISELAKVVQTCIQGVFIDRIFIEDKEKLRERFNQIETIIVESIIMKSSGLFGKVNGK